MFPCGSKLNKYIGERSKTMSHFQQPPLPSPSRPGLRDETKREDRANSRIQEELTTNRILAFGFGFPFRGRKGRDRCKQIAPFYAVAILVSAKKYVVLIQLGFALLPHIPVKNGEVVSITDKQKHNNYFIPYCNGLCSWFKMNHTPNCRR